MQVAELSSAAFLIKEYEAINEEVNSAPGSVPEGFDLFVLRVNDFYEQRTLFDIQERAFGILCDSLFAKVVKRDPDRFVTRQIPFYNAFYRQSKSNYSIEIAKKIHQSCIEYWKFFTNLCSGPLFRTLREQERYKKLGITREIFYFLYGNLLRASILYRKRNDFPESLKKCDEIIDKQKIQFPNSGPIVGGESFSDRFRRSCLEQLKRQGEVPLDTFLFESDLEALNLFESNEEWAEFHFSLFSSVNSKYLSTFLDETLLTNLGEVILEVLSLEGASNRVSTWISCYYGHLLPFYKTLHPKKASLLGYQFALSLCQKLFTVGVVKIFFKWGLAHLKECRESEPQVAKDIELSLAESLVKAHVVLEFKIAEAHFMTLYKDLPKEQANAFWKELLEKEINKK